MFENNTKIKNQFTFARYDHLLPWLWPCDGPETNRKLPECDVQVFWPTREMAQREESIGSRVWWIWEPLWLTLWSTQRSFLDILGSSSFVRRCEFLLKRPWSATEMFVCPRLQGNLLNTFPIIIAFIWRQARWKRLESAHICGYSGPNH